MRLPLVDNLQLALDGIATNKVRSGLTMLGVLIGVATVIALLSIGQGTSNSITGRITSAGTDLLVVSPGGQMGRGGVRGATGTASTLTSEDAEAVAEPANAPDVRAAAPEYSRNTQVIVGSANVNARLTGTTDAYRTVMSVEVARGRFIATSDVKSRAAVAVLGSGVAEDLFGLDDPVGQQIKVSIPGTSGLLPLRVVGLLAEQGESSIFGDIDEAIVVPVTTVQSKIAYGRNSRGEPILTSIRIVAQPGRSQQAASQITDLLRYRHGIGESDDDDFSVTSQEDLLTMASSVAGSLTLFLGAIALISLLVGGIGIMNIMLVSVTERTREIGIRKAVGARRSDILSQFLLEAVVLSGVGGLAGIVAGVGVALAVEASGTMAAAVSPQSVVLAAVFALAVGLVSGVYPARRAASLEPIEALRYE